MFVGSQWYETHNMSKIVILTKNTVNAGKYTTNFTGIWIINMVFKKSTPLED